MLLRGLCSQQLQIKQEQCQTSRLNPVAGWDGWTCVCPSSFRERTSCTDRQTETDLMLLLGHLQQKPSFTKQLQQTLQQHKRVDRDDHHIFASINDSSSCKLLSCYLQDWSALNRLLFCFTEKYTEPEIPNILKD